MLDAFVIIQEDPHNRQKCNLVPVALENLCECFEADGFVLVLKLSPVPGLPRQGGAGAVVG